MSTDNRTNEQLSGSSGQFTDEQVEAAAKALEDHRHVMVAPGPHECSCGHVLHGWAAAHKLHRARAALVAAQGAAPQAEHEDLITKTLSVIHGDLRAYSHAEVKHLLYPLIDALRAAPQAERVVDAAGNEAQKRLRCGKYVFECCESFAPVLPSSGVDEDALADVINAAMTARGMPGLSVGGYYTLAKAVAAWLKGQGGESRGDR